MGTRSYALQVLNVLDPDQKFFGNRVLSRDESGSLSFKSLKRLFPVDTSMVVVIDDRGDVWEWCENLVKVKPCKWSYALTESNCVLSGDHQTISSLASPAVLPTLPCERIHIRTRCAPSLGWTHVASLAQIVVASHRGLLGFERRGTGSRHACVVGLPSTKQASVDGTPERVGSQQSVGAAVEGV